MNGLKSSVIIGVAGLIGAIIFFVNKQPLIPPSSIDLRYSRSEIIDLATIYLEKRGYDVRHLYTDANFRFDSGITTYLETVVGLREAHRILRADSLLTHCWDVYYFDKNLPPSQMTDEYWVRITPTGKTLWFQHILQDSIAIPSLDFDAAKKLAENFLQSEGHTLQRLVLENSSIKELKSRRDYEFKWVSKDSVFDMQARLFVDVHGNRVGRYRVDLQEPEGFARSLSGVQTFVNFIVTASSTATFVLLIFIIALFLKKYHDGEVGVKTAISIFLILFALSILDYLLQFTSIGYQMGLGDVNRYNVRIVVFVFTVFIVQAFMCAMAFAGWSVGESSARRGWFGKLKAIDGLYFGKPFTVELANAITRGYGFGFAIIGMIIVVLLVASNFGNPALFVVSLSGIVESKIPALSAVLLGLRISLLNEIVFRFFFISWLREKTRRTWQGLLISSLLWSLFAFTLWDFPFGSPSFRILFPAYFLLSFILGLIVVRYDLMTAVVTNFVILAIGYASPILVASAPFYQTQSWLFYLLLVAPLGVAVVGYLKRQQFRFSVEVTPTHIKRISERERMSKELEIARNVQMSLLPKTNPLVEGYDIAGVCIPALEVGGDYYDFFQLGNGKIGIAIGDVSGKGVPAAIYMTLTKGILQSHAGESASPKEVLNKLNRQMYSNIERSSFVSMFYAVLDMTSHKIRFSRAGHNPAILAQRSKAGSSLIQPGGIALGLEAGEKFQTCLEEHELALQSGDVLAFYTDGFTEACNSKDEEFGEERLEAEISSAKELSANAVIQQVVRSVKAFVGNHPQHDDMTMVVLKVS